MPSNLNPLAREFIPRAVSAPAEYNASSTSNKYSLAQRLSQQRDWGIVEGQVRRKQGKQRQGPVILGRSTSQVPRTWKPHWDEGSGWQYSSSYPYQYAQGIGDRRRNEENAGGWEVYQASSAEEYKAIEVEAVWRKYGAILSLERAFDGGYYGEYIAEEKLRCYEVEQRGLRMGFNEGQRTAYQLSEYHNCQAKSKNQRNCHDKLAAQGLLPPDEILYKVPQLALWCKLYPLRTVLNGEVRGFPRSLWDLEMMRVSQVRNLLTAYEGYRRYDTEIQLRRRLSEYIGAVTIFG